MRRIRPGFTTRARCLIAGGLTAALCGLAFGEVDLIRAGSLVVAVPIVAAIVVNRSQVTIASRRGVSQARAAAGSEVVVQLTVTNRSLLSTGALMLEDRLPAGLTGRARFVLDGLNGRETRTVAYHVPALPRGSYTAGPLRVRLTDPFGLIDATRSFTARSRFVITPIVDRLPDLHLPNSWDLGENAGSHSIGSRGADDASTREWRHGDDLRKIHWRSTARTGTLMVRHEERPWQGHATLLLDLRAQAHDAPDQRVVAGDDRHRRSIEWAISAIASIGSQLFITGRDVSLIADPAAPDRARFASQASFVDHLAEVVPTRNDSLLPIVAQLRAAMRDSTVVAVLGRVDDATVHALAEAHPRGSATPAFAILLDVDSWRDADPDGEPGDVVGDEPDPVPERQVPETIWSADGRRVAETLRASGWCVVPARSGDAMPVIWTRLLRQRGGGPGAAASAAARLTTLR
jgi:uncharacterized protein (DUF58 family)